MGGAEAAGLWGSRGHGQWALMSRVQRVPAFLNSPGPEKVTFKARKVPWG